ncbi:hypothetical protein ACF1AE_19180 [Streptomyces sp. NPDC014986]|uniref:hypothetical protein n=1 Tax=Streptomyces sp. NPDC014986 TaxID=3364934 RepID=UPI0036FEF1BC
MIAKDPRVGVRSVRRWRQAWEETCDAVDLSSGDGELWGGRGRERGEVLDAGAGGIELSEQGDGLASHSLLDLWGPAHVRDAQGVSQSFDSCLDAALAAGLLQQ